MFTNIKLLQLVKITGKLVTNNISECVKLQDQVAATLTARIALPRILEQFQAQYAADKILGNYDFRVIFSDTFV